MGDDAGEVAGVLGVVGCRSAAAMNSACVWFLAKMIVLPSRSPPATLWPCVIRVGEHLVDGVLVEQEPVELLGGDLVGRSPSSPQSSASHSSFSSSDRSS